MNTIVINTQTELDALPKKIEANLEIKFNAAKCAAEEISGDLRVYGTAKLDAPALTSVGGDLYVDGTAKLEALTSVGGGLYVYGTAKLDAPALTSVGGGLYVYNTAKLDAPALTSVGGYLRVYNTAKLDAPALTSVGGDLRVYGTGKLDAPALTSVGGYLSVDGAAKLDALTSVGGDLSVNGTAKLDAPALTSVGGYLSVDGAAKLDALTSVGGDLSVNGTAKLDAPALTSVGGYLRVYNTAKLPKNIVGNDAKAKQMAISLRFNLRVALRMSFLLNGFLFADGILGKVLGKKEIGANVVYELAIRGGLKKTFCVQNGETFSHGDTIEKAIADLRYKISDRDTSKFEHWKNNLDQKITVDEAIAAYRTITGACEMGTKQFVESIDVPEKLTPRIVLEMTKDKFGNGDLAEFLKGE